jgi:hypothetical protein
LRAKKESTKPKTYASVVWCAEDVLTKAAERKIRMTMGEAREFLERNAKFIQSDMVERGWDSIDTLLMMEEKA